MMLPCSPLRDEGGAQGAAAVPCEVSGCYIVRHSAGSPQLFTAVPHLRQGVPFCLLLAASMECAALQWVLGGFFSTSPGCTA